ncbi:MAG: hydantoinase/oxoprolinase family protein [Deltaproteobacteria bacterium]|nr:hydantoinase/oxoprolinase family protein [Deltaproteobacteria bacterium]MBW2122105.1 hydantoinase/oxoprolinase family protein [Deltaproteobacteria bacterium]
MSKIVAVDTGGTFTDIVVFDQQTKEIYTCKTSTNTEIPAENIINALKDISIESNEITRMVHATTIATNAIIERKGERTGLLTNKGFKDIVFIQRGDQERSYDLQWVKPKPLVKRRDCREIDCRMDCEGRVLREPDSKELERIVEEFRDEGVKAIAVCLLFSYADPSHELRARDTVKRLYPECFVSLSHEVYPRWREYQRFSTTIADAYLKPVFGPYVKRLVNGLKRANDRLQLLIMKSNGGVTDWTWAIEHPIESIMSGPVGGVLAAGYFSGIVGEKSLIALDMGGTSCDVSLIEGGRCSYTTDFVLEFGIPINVPMVDVKSVGAGGGSIAWVDKGGLLRVGPQSAGAVPGPACYGSGGRSATVTDANLVLGRLNPDYFCGGKLPLYPDRGRKAIEELSSKLGKDPVETADDIIALASSNVANAVRLVTIEKGIDPRDFAIFGFGGAGGLHVLKVADMLGISTVIIPVHPGVTSALGLLTADLRVDRMVTFLMRSDVIDERLFNEYLKRTRTYALGTLEREGFKGESEVFQSLEMRYYGQNYQIEVPIPDRWELTREDIESAFVLFGKKHRELYGYENPGDVVECVGMIVRSVGKTRAPEIGVLQRRGSIEIKERRPVYFGREEGFLECPIYERSSLPDGFSTGGPAIIEEPVSTILLLPGHELEVDCYGNLVIRKAER